MKRMIIGAIVAGVAAILLIIVAQAQSDTCRQGYVWREAFRGDHVCVTPATRTQAAYDNSQANARVEPGGGAYGPNTCRSGYVWREARPGDLVCVTPETRTQTAYDNSQAKNRIAPPAAPPAAPTVETHKFIKPRWFDYRLDWCLNWGADCGKPAADYYCKDRMWTGAVDFAADPNIGATEPTMLIGSKQVCDQSFCTGFKYITCYGKIPSSRIFDNPTWNGYRLDECYTWDTGCGKRAADTFCSAKGYKKSFYYKIDSTPSLADTLTIGTNQICDVNDWDCYGFQKIICQ